MWICAFAPHCAVYGGLDMVGTTFRTGKDLSASTGLTAYDNALATCRDLRIRAGVDCEILRGLRAEVEAGALVCLRVDYARIDTQVEFDPALYVRLGLN